MCNTLFFYNASQKYLKIGYLAIVETVALLLLRVILLRTHFSADVANSFLWWKSFW